MTIAILVIVLLIFVETTILFVKSSQKPLISSNQKRRIYIDTSALMDPRLLAVAQTGFLSGDLIIPRSVTGELQLLADGKDHEKRVRARAGLDAVRELERVVFFDLSIIDDPLDHTPVDNRLLELAKLNSGMILSNDFNLKKLAATEHIDVLSLNELALALKNEFLPGERAKVKLLSAGSGPNQAIAYLKDGTLVVVDKADKRIGEEVEVEFLRLNQSASGTMMFAKLVNTRSSDNTQRTQKNQIARKPRVTNIRKRVASERTPSQTRRK